MTALVPDCAYACNVQRDPHTPAPGSSKGGGRGSKTTAWVNSSIDSQPSKIFHKSTSYQ